MALKNQVQLITYPDSLGGNLQELRHVLDRYFSDVFKGGIHILPPFPSSGDRGFAPLSYFEIEPSFGTWDDIQALGKEYNILLDVMVNHISQQSIYFQDFLKEGRDSQYADLFITLDKLWENGVPVQEDIDKMFLRRPVPYSSFRIDKTGQEEKVWTTFGKTDPSEQIDLDINTDKVKQLITQIFENFKKNNVKIVRLDAVGYIVKKMGTDCFFVEPDIYTFLDWIMDLASSLEIELLPEVHAHHSIQYKLADYGCWIYDFILPYRILDTLLHQDSEALKDYLRTRPTKQFTMLDCHDGIPIKPDLDGLIDPKDGRKLVDTCVARGANLSLIVSDQHKSEDGFDVHQIRCSYYSMLQDDDGYLAARAIQFFTPGIPQVYYVGLLAGENDIERVKLTGEGREINRHNFTIAEIEQALQKETVQRLLKLIQFRNQYEAFQGSFHIETTEATELALRWSHKSFTCRLYVNLLNYKTIITYLDEQGNQQVYVV